MDIQHKKSPNTTKTNTSGFHQAWYILTESAVITATLLLTPHLGLLLSFAIALASTIALFKLPRTLPKQLLDRSNRQTKPFYNKQPAPAQSATLISAFDSVTP